MKKDKTGEIGFDLFSYCNLCDLKITISRQTTTHLLNSIVAMKVAISFFEILFEK